MGTVLRLTTNPGLEDVVESELRSRLRRAGMAMTGSERKPFGLAGNVLAEFPHSIEELGPIVSELRSVSHVIEHRAWFPLPDQDPLAAMAERLAGVDIPEMQAAKSFRVTTLRVGDHDFTSVDVQRTAGAVLLGRYGVPVDLLGYELNVRVDVIGSHCLVGLQLTDERLDKRHQKVYQPRVTLRPTVAYAMLALCGLERLAGRSGSSQAGALGRLLDPFCGSGNILLEAADVLPHFELHGCDYNPQAVQGAQENLRAAGAAARSFVRCADARELDALYPAGFFDAIVTDPPYGIRMGRNLNFHGLYVRFLAGAWKVLVPQGRLAILVGRQRTAFNRVLKQLGGFRVLHARVIETSGVYPTLFVLERAERSPEAGEVAGPLYSM